MSTEETGELSGREYDRVLASIRSDARAVREAIERMSEDRDKLLNGGHPAPAALLSDCIVSLRLTLRCLGDVFRVEL